MRLRQRIRGLCLLLALAGCAQEAPQARLADTAEAADPRPNILFIVADDLGFTDIGAFGSEIATPTLDELAFNGLRIANLHAGPACQQTRTMMMASTGDAIGIEVRPRQPGGERDNLLRLEWAIIPELLQDAGYATFATGKWDLGRDAGYTAATRGFDRSFVQLNGSSSYFKEYLLVPGELGFEDDGVRVEFDDLDEDFYVTDHYTDKMLEYLGEADTDTPWFAYMPYTAPHWPLQLPDDWLDRKAGDYDMGYDQLREQRAARAMELGVIPTNASLENYVVQAEPWDKLSAGEQQKYARAQEIFAAMIEHLDMSIARIVRHLEETGQLENTVIIFTADHGASRAEFGVDTGRVPLTGGPSLPEGLDNSLENFGRKNSFIDHGLGFAEAATAPFRYQKGSHTEGGLRAAAFVYYPAAVEAGGVTHAHMTMMDILPTFMEIAGTQHPGAGPYKGREIRNIRGSSAWAHLTGQADDVHDANSVVGWAGRGRGGAFIRGDYKIINTAPPGERGITDWRLYNLVADPGERKDIAADHPERVASMVEEWESNWRP